MTQTLKKTLYGVGGTVVGAFILWFSSLIWTMYDRSSDAYDQVQAQWRILAEINTRQNGYSSRQDAQYIVQTEFILPMLLTKIQNTEDLDLNSLKRLLDEESSYNVSEEEVNRFKDEQMKIYRQEVK